VLLWRSGSSWNKQSLDSVHIGINTRGTNVGQAERSARKPSKGKMMVEESNYAERAIPGSYQCRYNITGIFELVMTFVASEG
jgi:hypothetical protein